MIDGSERFDRILDEVPRGKERPRCLIQGDLYSRHLIVDVDGAVTGVIDWGDSHLGDPAVDLMIALTFLPAEATDAFLDAYGPVDPATWRLARFAALWHAASCALYARDIDDADLLREAMWALERIGK